MNRRAWLCPLLGLLAFLLPLSVGVWIKMQSAQEFHDRAGIMITMICFPLALAGALIPRLILAFVAFGLPRSGKERTWVILGTALTGGGVLLAIGTLLLG
jgi:hypothetical protein